MDGAQEHLHYVVDICNDVLYLLDPGDKGDESSSNMTTFCLSDPMELTSKDHKDAQDQAAPQPEPGKRCQGKDGEQTSSGYGSLLLDARNTSLQSVSDVIATAPDRVEMPSSFPSSAEESGGERHVSESGNPSESDAVGKVQSGESGKRTGPVKAFSESDGTWKKSPTRSVQFLLCKQGSVNEPATARRPHLAKAESLSARSDSPVRRTPSPTPPPLPPRSPRPACRSASCDAQPVSARTSSPHASSPPLPPERHAVIAAKQKEDLMQCLVKAVQVNDVAQIQRLHDAGSGVSQVCDRKGMTVLHYAAAAGRDAIVQFLTDKFGKEFLNQQDHDGRTALHVAVEAKNRRVSGLLAVAGASLSVRSSQCLTAQETALKVGDEHLAAYLNRKCDRHFLLQSISNESPSP